MRVVFAVSVLLSFIAGLVAAFWWWKASRVEIDPEWGPGGEPVDTTASNSNWIVAVMKSASISANLNRKAALWTAAAVALNAIAAAVGILMHR